MRTMFWKVGSCISYLDKLRESELRRAEAAALTPVPLSTTRGTIAAFDRLVVSCGTPLSGVFIWLCS